MMPYGFAIVFYRQLLAWRYYIKNFLALSVFDPLLWIYAMGVGLSGMLKMGDAYLLFLASGMVASVITWGVAMDATINTMNRLEQGLWKATLSTPVTLSALTLGEATFSATRGMLSGLIVALVSLLFVDFPNLWGLLPALLFVWLGGLVLHLMCLCFTALARGFSDFDFFWPLLLNPMFMLSGVFFTVDNLPTAVQSVAYALPLLYVVESVRTLLDGTFTLTALTLNASVLTAMGILFYSLQRVLFQRRMYA